YAKELTADAVLTEIEWINPHGWLHFDVKTPSGTQKWLLQTPPPNVWRKLGVASKGFLNVGQTYHVQAAPGKTRLSKEGEIRGMITVLVFPDGRRLSMVGVSPQGQ